MFNINNTKIEAGNYLDWLFNDDVPEEVDEHAGEPLVGLVVPELHPVECHHSQSSEDQKDSQEPS